MLGGDGAWNTPGLQEALPAAQAPRPLRTHERERLPPLAKIAMLPDQSGDE